MLHYHSDVIHTNEPQFARNRLRLLVAGSARAGKTALIRRMIDNVYRENAEIADRFHQQRLNVTAKVVEGSLYKVEVQEVDSLVFGENKEESEKPRVHEFINWLDVQSIICVYDVTSEESYLEANRILLTLQKKAAPDCDVCLVGTKADRKPERRVSFSRAEADAEKKDLSLIEVSSLDGTNVQLLFDDVIDKQMERIFVQQQCHKVEESEDEKPIYQNPIEELPVAAPSIFCFWPFRRS